MNTFMKLTMKYKLRPINIFFLFSANMQHLIWVFYYIHTNYVSDAFSTNHAPEKIIFSIQFMI